MNFDRHKLAIQAVSSALKVRSKAGVEPTLPICIFDMVESQGVEIRFEKADSMEGLYVSQPGPIILIGSSRPAGRQAYTCAHEFGHHVFGHGTHVDELDSAQEGHDPDEYIADCFAAAILMPKLAVLRSLRDRGWTTAVLDPLKFYTLACYFGVGYSTLVNHLHYMLNLVTAVQHIQLLKRSPKNIRKEILGEDTIEGVHVIDRFWTGRPIDLEVGDVMCLPKGSLFEGQCISESSGPKPCTYAMAVAPGLGRVCFQTQSGEQVTFVRVRRREYVGLSLYRHLAEG